MRKPLLYLFIIVLLVRVWIWFGENDPFGTQADDNAAVASDEAEITLDESRVRPRAISVRTGAEVKWINESSEARALQAASGQLGSAEVAPGEAFTWEAAEPGVIHYTVDAEGREGHVVIVNEGEQLFDGRNPAEEYQDTCSGCHGPERRGAIGPALLPGRLTEIDYSQPEFPIEKVKDVGRVLHDGFLSPDNRFFYLAAQDDDLMAVIDVEKWEVVDRIETGNTPPSRFGCHLGGQRPAVPSDGPCRRRLDYRLGPGEQSDRGRGGDQRPRPLHSQP